MTEIDDEMVERYIEAAGRKAIKAGGYLRADDKQREITRAGLEAALNPKPEPEIEVSEGMCEAGRLEAERHGWNVKGMDEHELVGWWCDIKSIYRAMESTRLKEAEQEPRRETVSEILERFRREAAPEGAKSAPQGVSAAAPEQTIGSNVGLWGNLHTHRRKGDQGSTLAHRRKDDMT